MVSVGSSGTADSRAQSTKTIVVLGASYGGARAARMLSELLAKEKRTGWRVVVVDRNTHANHVYVFPRFTILPSHGEKSFIPYSQLMHHPALQSESASADVLSNNLFIRASIVSIDDQAVKIQRLSDGSPGPIEEIAYQYLIYALGSTLPEPVDPWHAHAQLAAAEAGTDEAAREIVEHLSGKANGHRHEQGTFFPRKGSNGRSISPGSSADGRDALDMKDLRSQLPNIAPRPPSPVLPPTPQSASSSMLPPIAPAIQHNPAVASSINGGWTTTSPSTPGFGFGVSPWLPPTPPCRSPDLKPRTLKRPVPVHELNRAVSSASLKHLARHDHVRGAGTREQGLEWMHGRAEMIERARRVVILGGGALGIQFATDIKDVYPDKEVTLMHSRDQLLPLYPREMHDIIAERCKELGVNLVLGERAQSMELRMADDEESGVDVPEIIVTTSKGRTVGADIVLPCTGQRPNTAIMRAFLPHAILPTNERISIRRTMQLSRANVDIVNIEDRLFAVGDCAEAFGAIQSGNAAYYQAEVAVRNILRLVRSEDGADEEELEGYKPNPPQIKVTLGLRKYVKCNLDGISSGEDGKEDLDAKLMWFMFGAADLADQLEA